MSIHRMLGMGMCVVCSSLGKHTFFSLTGLDRIVALTLGLSSAPGAGSLGKPKRPYHFVFPVPKNN